MPTLLRHKALMATSRYKRKYGITLDREAIEAAIAGKLENPDYEVVVKTVLISDEIAEFTVTMRKETDDGLTKLAAGRTVKLYDFQTQ